MPRKGKKIIDTTEDAIGVFLKSSPKTKYTFAYELYERVGAETWFELFELFNGKKVAFPSKKEFDEYMQGQTDIINNFAHEQVRFRLETNK